MSELLPVEELAPGTWRIAASWHGRALFPGEGHQELELADETTYEVPVPEGAVRGQEQDTLLRAGRLQD